MTETDFLRAHQCTVRKLREETHNDDEDKEKFEAETRKLGYEQTKEHKTLLKGMSNERGRRGEYSYDEGSKLAVNALV